MQVRLKLCTEYLKEVETKLTRLRSMVSEDLEAKAKISEALDLTEQASATVAQIQTCIGQLRRSLSRT